MLTTGDEAKERAERLKDWTRTVERFILNGRPAENEFERRAAGALARLTSELDRVTAERDELVRAAAGIGTQRDTAIADLKRAEDLVRTTLLERDECDRQAAAGVVRIAAQRDGAVVRAEKAEAERDELRELRESESLETGVRLNKFQSMTAEAIASRNAWASAGKALLERLEQAESAHGAVSDAFDDMEQQMFATKERAEKAEQGLVMWMEAAKQARAQAFAECAEIAEAYEPECESCPRGVTAAIRAKAGGT